MKQRLRMMRILMIAVTGVVGGCSANPPPKPSSEAVTATASTTTTEVAEGASKEASETPMAPAVPAPFVIRPVDWETVTHGIEVVSVTPAELKGKRLEDRYPTQVVQVRGAVAEIGNDLMGREFTSLRMQGAAGETTSFRVFEPQAFARVGPGQTVTLQGIKFDVSPIEHFPFRILDAGTNPCPIISSLAISEDFANDSQLAHEKYYGQWFYVQGNVADIRKEWDENVLVTLESNPDWPIASWVKKADTEATAIAVGKTFSMLAKYEPTEDLTGQEQKVELKGSSITVAFPSVGMTYGTTMLSRAERDLQSAERIRLETPAIDIDAAALIRQFRDGEVEFRTDYADKIAEITGVVQEFGVQRDGHSVIHLVGDELLTFEVAVTKDEPWDRLQPGQKITTRGQFVRSPSIPRIEQGIIVKADAPEKPLRLVSTADLVAGCMNSNETFVSDWKDQFVKVTGKILSVDLSDVDPIVELEGPDGARVQLELSFKQHARQNRFNQQSIGKTMTFLGRVNAVDDDAKVVNLKDGWILKASGDATP